MFPLDSIDMDKFIFDESKLTWEEYFSNVKKILSPSLITTNDTLIEEKNDKMENYNVNIKSNNMSFEEKEQSFFSYNNDESLDDFM